MSFILLNKQYRSYLMGFAIMWVILFHSGMFPSFYHIKDVYFLSLLFGNGYLGVDIFIFLSVFGLCHSYCGNTMKTFYLHRFRRLFPMYWIYLAIMAVFFPMVIKGQTLKFFLLQSTGGASFLKDRIEWYIPFLILIYLTFPFLYKVFDFLYKRKLVEIVVFLSVFAMRWVSKIPMDDYCLTRFPLILLAMQTFRSREEPAGYLRTYGCALLSVVVFTNQTSLAFSVMMPTLLFFLSQMPLDRLPFKKTFSRIGKYTLEIYLAQNIAFNQFLQVTTLPYWMSMAVCLVIIVATAMILHLMQNCAFKLFKT